MTSWTHLRIISRQLEAGVWHLGLECGHTVQKQANTKVELGLLRLDCPECKKICDAEERLKQDL